MRSVRMKSCQSLFLFILWILASLGCGSEEPASHEETNATEAKSPETQAFVPVDFQAKANQELYEGLPNGSQSFKGVNYQIGDQLLQLGSGVFPKFPSRIEGIEVNQPCRAIHFLQSSQGGAFPQPNHPKHEDDGVEIGQYVIHYADGSQATQPIVYGEHLREWWNWDSDKPTAKSEMVWTGDNPQAGRYQKTIRFYWAVWENPHPEKPVATIDFVSANQKAAPFCLAMSLESLTK